MAGYTVDQDGRMPDSLVDDLLVSGTEDQVRDRLAAIRQCGIDELLISHVPVADEEPELEALSSILASGSRSG